MVVLFFLVFFGLGGFWGGREEEKGGEEIFFFWWFWLVLVWRLFSQKHEENNVCYFGTAYQMTFSDLFEKKVFTFMTQTPMRLSL